MPTPEPKARRPVRPLLLVAALCLLGSLYAITLARAQSAKMSNDETVYLDSARQIARSGCPLQSVGAGYVFLDNPPLVPYVTALARAFGAETLAELRFVSVSLWGLLAYVGTFLVAQRMFGPAAGLLTLALLFTQRRFMIGAAFVELDVPLAALSMFFLFNLYQVAHSAREVVRRRAGIACGLIVGLACSTKYQGILLPVMGLGYLVFATADTPLAAARQNWRPCLEMLLGTGIAAGVWYALAGHCGGDLFRAIDYNLARITFETSEPWFHQPLLGRDGYWWNLARTLGPALVGGGIVGSALWGRRLFSDPRFKLLGLWILINLAFCSAIGLRTERYFFSAGLAVAVAAGSLATREAYEGRVLIGGKFAWAKATHAALVIPMLFYSAYAANEFISQTDRLARNAANRDYELLADIVRWSTAKDERVLSTSPQIAYLADRNYYVSHWEPNGARWLDLVSNPSHRIAMIVFASQPTLHPDMPEDERERVTRYVNEHFKAVPVDDMKAQVLRRVSY